MKYRTTIEIVSDAENKNEALEIVGEYLVGNIVSGIDMKCVTKPVRFYNNTMAKLAVVVLLVTVGFLSGVKAKPQHGFAMSIYQTDAVTPPLKTSDANKRDLNFKKEWEQKQTREALNFIKK